MITVTNNLYFKILQFENEMISIIKGGKLCSERLLDSKYGQAE